MEVIALFATLMFVWAFAALVLAMVGTVAPWALRFVLDLLT